MELSINLIVLSVLALTGVVADKPTEFLERWSTVECGTDMVCGVGARGEMGPFQINPSVWRGRGCQGDPWNWEDSAECASGYLDNLAGRQRCPDNLRWGLASYNAGIGNVLHWQEEHGCVLDALPQHVLSYVERVAGLPVQDTRKYQKE